MKSYNNRIQNDIRNLIVNNYQIELKDINNLYIKVKGPKDSLYDGVYL